MSTITGILCGMVIAVAQKVGNIPQFKLNRQFEFVQLFIVNTRNFGRNKRLIIK